mmetsp:Transcript_25833/g.74399  ORF Transcript_25833/g.74399 Transcript_25833/m.74399 type:complete len:220 (+) Transcript_25833:1304-1963(+)
MRLFRARAYPRGASGRLGRTKERRGAHFHRLHDLLVGPRRGRRHLQHDERHCGAEPCERGGPGHEEQVAAGLARFRRGAVAGLPHRALRRALSRPKARSRSRRGHHALVIEDIGLRVDQLPTQPPHHLAQLFPHDPGWFPGCVPGCLQRLPHEPIWRRRSRVRHGHAQRVLLHYHGGSLSAQGTAWSIGGAHGLRGPNRDELHSADVARGRVGIGNIQQ